MLPSHPQALRRAFLLLVLGGVSLVQADVISYWRFEQNNSTSPTFINPNEIGTEPDMVMQPNVPGSFANGGQQYTNVPVNPIPDTGATNDFAVGIVGATSGGAGIYGIAAYSPTLDVENMTVEFFFRTAEGEAEFVARTANPSSATPGAPIDDGFRAGLSPNSGERGQVQVLYHTSADGINSTQIELITPTTFNDSQWHHFAFTYNDATGVGQLYIDGVLQDSNDGPDGEDIFWRVADTPEVYIGYRMDGGTASSSGGGLLDEIRWSNVVLDPGGFLNAPEPETYLAGGLLLLAAGMYEYRRRRRTQPANSSD